MNDRTIPVIFSAADLKLDFPQPHDQLLPNDAEANRNAVVTGGAYTAEGEALIEKGKIKTLLGTDAAGANDLISDLPDSSKIENGKKVFVKVSALSTPLSERIQEPRPPYELLRLKDTEICLNTLRDDPALEVRRHNLEGSNQRIMPKVKAAALKESTTCISGQPLESDAEVHHIDRLADNPRRAADPTNLRPANKDVHRLIHQKKAHGMKRLQELAAEEGWPDPEAPPN